jgi:xyloglucan-specific exo-beta-1,4-glucanase
VVRAGSNVHIQASSDAGATWAAIGHPSTDSGTGDIAVSADGKTIIYTAWNGIPWRTHDGGSTWARVSGLTTPTYTYLSWAITADRVNPAYFYTYDRNTGYVWVSSDSGKTFASSATLNSWGTPPIVASNTTEGKLWMSVYDWGSGGLYYSTNHGSSWTAAAGTSTIGDVYGVALGKAATGSSYETVYAHGKLLASSASAKAEGIYRSIDNGATWALVNDTTHQYGNINTMSADPNTYGRVFLGTGGRGLIYGQISGTSSIQSGSSATKKISSIRRVGQNLVADGAASIKLLDLQGKVVRQSETVSGSQSLSLAGLPRGIFVANRGTESLRVETLR